MGGVCIDICEKKGHTQNSKMGRRARNVNISGKFCCYGKEKKIPERNKRQKKSKEK